MEKCKICDGTKAEHFDESGQKKTIHEFTTREGDLRPPKEKPEIRPEQMVTRLQMPGAALEVTRLVEVMMDKGLLTVPEVLYIAGVGPKPAAPSGYLDPATVMQVNR